MSTRRLNLREEIYVAVFGEHLEQDDEHLDPSERTRRFDQRATRFVTNLRAFNPDAFANEINSFCGRRALEVISREKIQHYINYLGWVLGRPSRYRKLDAARCQSIILGAVNNSAAFGLLVAGEKARTALYTNPLQSEKRIIARPKKEHSEADNVLRAIGFAKKEITEVKANAKMLAKYLDSKEILDSEMPTLQKQIEQTGEYQNLLNILTTSVTKSSQQVVHMALKGMGFDGETSSYMDRNSAVVSQYLEAKAELISPVWSGVFNRLEGMPKNVLAYNAFKLALRSYIR